MAAFVIETPNGFNPHDMRKHTVTEGITIAEWLRASRPGDNHMGFKEWDFPTVCAFNGEYIVRDQWQMTFLKKNDVVQFVTVPQGPFIIIALIIVVVAIAVTIAFSAMAPKAPGELPASDPVFSTKGQYNAIRLGEPIEVCYGRNRMFPSLAARPYFQYIDNDQFQYVLFCLGRGYFSVEQILIGDTDIDDFQEVQYELIQPGGTVTLFPTNVITSVEVGGQNLFGTNEPEYVSGGWVGPFAANPPTTDADTLQIDVVFPKGLYSTDSKGRLQSAAIGIQWQARPIDDLGAPLGPYVDLFAPSPKVVSGSTTTPQRRSYSATVTPGRYEVRLRRTNSFDSSYKVGNDASWEGMRAYIQTEQDWGEVTLMAVKIRATNNLNERTQTRFNVIATRKLPIRSALGVWSAPTATRSIIWAFVDVFRATYGGKITNDAYFDWASFLELDDLYTDRDEHFDWVFRDPITVWEAAQAIGQVGRAVPLLSGSLITIKRHGPLTVPVTMFTPDIIHKGTFKNLIKMRKPDDNDSIRIEYTEPDTGYKQETVLCVLPGGSSDNPKDVRLIGVQDRAHAYHQGMFILACEKYLRRQTEFETGLDGHIPAYGDLVALTHDVPRWGQYGFIVNAVTGVGNDKLVWLSEPVTFQTDTVEHIMMLRDRDGSLLGPFDATRTDDPMQVILNAPGVIDFLLAGDGDPMLFYFGVAGAETQLSRLVRLEPSGDDSVNVVAVADKPVIHSFDALTPPALSTISVAPVPPDLPTILQLFLSQVSDVNNVVQASWTAAFGALYYVVQTSQDNVNWEERGTTVQTYMLLQVRPGDLWVRVAAVNNGQGPWTTATTSIGVVTGLDDITPWEFLEWGISWFTTLNAISYTVRVYDNTDPLSPLLKRTTTGITDLTFNYHYDPEALADGNLVRQMKVTVDAAFTDGESGLPTELTLSNAIPLPPTSPASSSLGIDSDFNKVYHLSWVVPDEDDLITVKVWVSTTPGFDPSLTVPFWTFTAVSPGASGIPNSRDIEIPLDTSGTHDTLYWRVALFDVWGNEIDTNITAQQTIAAFP